MDIFFDRINPLILKSGKQNREIERALKLPKDAIYNWRNGVTKSYEKPEYIRRFADYFHVSEAYLRGMTDDPTPKDAAPKGGAGDATESADRFIRLYRQASPWLQDQVLALLKAAESQHEAADADSKDRPVP